MTLPVRLGPEASAELADAARWYENRRAGLGSMFLDAVDATVESISRWPRTGAKVEGLPGDLEVRRAPVARYPYHVAYLVADDEVHVLAVAHDRRLPAYWSGRA
ncbi:MAG: type II toxin-antitoxin system RelE/ParE family toxin [Acidimicrobiales bacterium]